MAVALDRTDRQIIKLLCEDGRISMRTLAQRVGLSRASIYTRMDHLRAEGVIEGFTARVNPRALGLEVAAFIILTVEQVDWRDALHKLRAMPEVVYCAFTAADFDAVLLIRVPSVDTIRDVILERLHAMPEVKATRTVLILDEATQPPAGLIDHIGS